GGGGSGTGRASATANEGPLTPGPTDGTPGPTPTDTGPIGPRSSSGAGMVVGTFVGVVKSILSMREGLPPSFRTLSPTGGVGGIGAGGGGGATRNVSSMWAGKASTRKSGTTTSTRIAAVWANTDDSINLDSWNIKLLLELAAHLRGRLRRGSQLNPVSLCFDGSFDCVVRGTFQAQRQAPQYGIGFLQDLMVRLLADLLEFKLPFVLQAEMNHEVFDDKQWATLRVCDLVEQSDCPLLARSRHER